MHFSTTVMFKGPASGLDFCSWTNSLTTWIVFESLVTVATWGSFVYEMRMIPSITMDIFDMQNIPLFVSMCSMLCELAAWCL